MLVFQTDQEMKLIFQHDHGLLSGELAEHWRGPEESPLPFLLKLAISFHDYSWEKIDHHPLWNPETGLPYDFFNYPTEKRLQMYREGLGEVAKLHPYMALLNSLHYTSFKFQFHIGSSSTRQKAEEERRQHLLKQIPFPLSSQKIEEDLFFLKLFDNLSLFICLCPPSALKNERFSWLTPEIFSLPNRSFHFQWQSDEVFSIDPFPFWHPFEVALPCYTLPQNRYSSEEAFLQAWRASEPQLWKIRVQEE